MEKVMAPHFSTLAWKIPWMEEPGRLQSIRLLWFGHDWVTSLSLFTFTHWRRQWQPTPVFLLENPKMGEPGGLPSMVPHRVGPDWSDLAAMSSYIWVKKKIPQNYSYSTYTKNIEHNSILISDNSSQHTHTQKANETYQLLCSNDLNTEDLILHIIIKVIYGAFLTHPSKKKYNLNLFKSFDMIFNL